MNRRVLKQFAAVTMSLLLISAVAFAQAGTTQSKATTTAGAQKSSTSTSTTKTTTGTTAKTTTPAKKKLDINSATKKELMELPGIGDALSQKIIDGRPYKAKNELTQKKILTDDVYAKISEQIIATQPKATTSAGAAAKTSTATTPKPATTTTTPKGK